MRILMVHPGPGYSVSDVHEGWREAFVNLGCSVAALNYDERLSFYSECGRLDDSGEFVNMVNEEGAVRLASKGIVAACFEWWPDVLFVTSCFYVPLDVLDIARERGIKVVIMHTEEPYELDRELKRAPHADLNLINDPIYLTEFPEGTIYVPHSYRPSLHRPGPVHPELRSDHVFVGTGYPSRIKFLESVDFAGVDFSLAGNWEGLDEQSPLQKYLVHEPGECIDNRRTVDLYQSSKTSSNIYRVESVRPELSDGWAIGPREVELAACGVWFARSPRGESDDLFPMLPTFSSPAEYGEIVRWAINHDDERERAALEARAAIANRTFEASAKRVLTLLERQ